MFFIMAEENASQRGDSPEHTDLVVESARDRLEASLPDPGKYELVMIPNAGSGQNKYLLKCKSPKTANDSSGRETSDPPSRSFEYHAKSSSNGVTWTWIKEYLDRFKSKDESSVWTQKRLQESLDRISRVSPSKWLTALEARYTALVAEKESEQEAAERVKRERKGKVETYLAKLNSLRLAPELINVLTNILT